MRGGKLRIYLGAAPGVGKTYAMLGEGHRRLARGTDVVVAIAETYGRALTAQMLEGLEVIPRRVMAYRGTAFEEMDIDTVLARRPAVALVDEMAHTNVPGSRNEKRWQDVGEMLGAGIEVISTLNIQHLESLNDVVQKITGVRQRETIPDAVVRAADQIELVDQTPEALRRRLAHGNVYPADKIDAALSSYFRTGNLTALRELALLWLADRVDEGLQKYREEHGIGGVWEARERVVVALTGGPEGQALLRRGARIAARSVGGDLLAVHVARSDGLTGANPAILATQRQLVESLGGGYHQVIGDDVPAALLEFARAENATQLVLGASRRSWLAALLTGPGTGFRTIRDSGDIDVHIVTHGEMGRGHRLPRLRGSLSLRRRIYGFAVAAVLGLALTAVLVPVRGQVNLISDTLAFLVVVVVAALTGGLYPAIFAAVGTSLLLNYFFIPPLHTFTIATANNLLALLIFVVVAIAVSSVVDLAARRTRQAARAAAESQTLATLAGSVVRGERGVTAMLERVREAFGMNSATLLERTAGPSGAADRGHGGAWPTAWSVAGSAGGPPVLRPEDADVEEPVGDDLCLALHGRPLPAEDRSVLAAFAANVAMLREQRRLADAAEAAKPIAEADRMRTALLAAAGHDLRAPLAAAKAALSGLRSGDVRWDTAEAAQLAAMADESVDRVSWLVDNLLDASRLQAGALSVAAEPTVLDDVVISALNDLEPSGDGVTVAIPAALPPVLADPALLERVTVNLLSNAIRYSPPSRPPSVTASVLGDRVELRVIDRGPGIPEAERDRVFAPFQRLGDSGGAAGSRVNEVAGGARETSGTGGPEAAAVTGGTSGPEAAAVSGGTGLGLSLARGLTEAMGGTLTADDTPGGGLTMTVSLPAASGGGTGSVSPDGGAARAGAAARETR
jgi:two-component system, OmpR family, sensor histidine kinase KdpD